MNNIDDQFIVDFKNRKIQRELKDPPKCWVPTHVNGEIGRIEFLCLKRVCDYKKRFMCEKCPRDVHFIEHHKYISRVADILNNEYYNVQWPDDPENQVVKMKDYLNDEHPKQQQAFQQEIDDYLDKLKDVKSSFSDSIDRIKVRFNDWVIQVEKTISQTFSKLESSIKSEYQSFVQKQQIFHNNILDSIITQFEPSFTHLQTIINSSFEQKNLDKGISEINHFIEQRYYQDKNSIQIVKNQFVSGQIPKPQINELSLYQLTAHITKFFDEFLKKNPLIDIQTLSNSLSSLKPFHD